MKAVLQILGIFAILGITAAFTAFADEAPSHAPSTKVESIDDLFKFKNPPATCGYGGEICLIDQPNYCCTGMCVGGYCQ
jgi:hypothetical protein